MHANSQMRLRTKAAIEFREFVVLSVYLYIAFGALILLKAGILREHGIEWAPWGLGVIKAMLVAKFILIGRAMRVGERFRTKPLIWQTLHRSLAFLGVVVVLTILEEIVVGLIHDRTAWQSIRGLGGGNAIEIGATLLVVFLIFFPYFAFRSLGEVMSDQQLLRLFLFERRQSETPRQ